MFGFSDWKVDFISNLPNDFFNCSFSQLLLVNLTFFFFLLPASLVLEGYMPAIEIHELNTFWYVFNTLSTVNAFYCKEICLSPYSTKYVKMRVKSFKIKYDNCVCHPNLCWLMCLFLEVVAIKKISNNKATRLSVE